MNIIDINKIPSGVLIFNGQCIDCKIVIEYNDNECYEMPDSLQRKAKCPRCNKDIILIRGRWCGKWTDPVFDKKDWYITPITPEPNK